MLPADGQIHNHLLNDDWLYGVLLDARDDQVIWWNSTPATDKYEIKQIYGKKLHIFISNTYPNTKFYALKKTSNPRMKFLSNVLILILILTVIFIDSRKRIANFWGNE